MKKFVRSLLLGALDLAELLVSAALHLSYGFYIFAAAVGRDLLSRALVEGRNTDATASRDAGDDEDAVLDGAVPPIVLVHGVFGFGKGRLGGLSYFAGAEKKDDRVLVPDLGSLTSVHDRARELFYYLKGGQVDYGEEHSKMYGHARFGRAYHRGHYPMWDEEHPAHFVGHSAGAQVIRLLQQMLHDKAFEGYEDTAENWVMSVTSLSGALNGTTRSYLDGIRPEDSRSLRPICLAHVCRVGITLYHWLDSPWLKRYYDFGFDHFDMSWRVVGLSVLPSLLAGTRGPFATGDWIMSDLTVQGAARMNAGVRTFPSTFYFSYASRRTARVHGVTVPSGVLCIHPLLFIRVLQMCRWRHPTDAEPPCEGYRDEDWEDNDGALNTFSMTHPRIPVEHPSLFVEYDSDCHPLQPGIWYYKIVEADHMTFVINRHRGGVQFDLIYDSIFQNCRKHVFRTTPPPTLPNQNSP
ncbi:lipase-like [Lolium rigidum]|uniref:lipase-like n=1 Tax=Lolium rigidum TaxID=89674 RepID=UPI001F5D0E37|nr:lipase-like [Lolium rigidum]